jgi:hypothetical protein
MVIPGFQIPNPYSHKDQGRVWLPASDFCTTGVAERNLLPVTDGSWVIKATLFGGLHRVFSALWKFGLCLVGRFSVLVAAQNGAPVVWL